MLAVCDDDDDVVQLYPGSGQQPQVCVSVWRDPLPLTGREGMSGSAGGVSI